MFSKKALLALACAVAPVLAIKRDEYCFHSISATFSNYTFAGNASDGPCAGTVEVTSLYASSKAWCNEAQFDAAVPFWQQLCRENNYTLINLSQIETDVTDAYIATLPIVDPDMNSTKTTVIASPVLLSQSYYKRAYKSYTTYDFALDKGKRYGWGLMGYWGGILVLGMVVKAWNFVASRTKMTPSFLTHFIDTYFVLPASFAPAVPHHQQLLYSHTVPRRLDSIIVFGFYALCIVLACVDYQSFSGNVKLRTIFHQNWQYSSDRTGILSYACLPFLWLFGGRNNIFLWATPFSVQSFNIFHRHIAWACTLLAVVHSINYSIVYQVYDKLYHSAADEQWWFMGMIATACMSALLIQSLTVFRRRGYETFLILHIIMCAVVIYALFRHTSFDGTKWNFYLWPIVAIWLFDRVARILRIIYCNLTVALGSHFVSTTSTTVRYNEECDLLTVELQPASNTLTPAPGQYYYLYQPFSMKGWENHPFSLGAFVPPEGAKSSRGSKLIFYIRPYDGWTKRLRNQCLDAKDAIHPKLLLEGAYGHTAPLHTFDTVLLVVGGAGISGAVPYIIDHVRRVRGQTKGSTRTTQIRFIWSARQRETFEDVFCNDLATLLHHGDISTSFFFTGSSSSSSSGIFSSRRARRSQIQTQTRSHVRTETHEMNPLQSSTQQNQNQNPQISFHQSRPAIPALIAAEVQEAVRSTTVLAVLCCGPAKMADECRDAVYRARTGGFRDVEYFEEAFGW
ncbi:ferric reductase NAD binding domain-containing protein [Aspergillus californicus]